MIPILVIFINLRLFAPSDLPGLLNAANRRAFTALLSTGQQSALPKLSSQTNRRPLEMPVMLFAKIHSSSSIIYRQANSLCKFHFFPTYLLLFVCILTVNVQREPLIASPTYRVTHSNVTQFILTNLSIAFDVFIPFSRVCF